MQLLPIKIILDLHPPKSKVCANELFYSRYLFYFLCHYSYSNLTLGSNTSCRELTRNFQNCEKQNRENTRQRKIITCTRQYLCGSAICLSPRSCRDFTIFREKIQVWQYSFFLSKKTTSKNPNHQNNGFYIICIGFTIGYKTGQKKIQRYNLGRLAYQSKPPLHGLSLRKSPIKNYATLFRVKSSSRSNTTRLHKAQHLCDNRF